MTDIYHTEFEIQMYNPTNLTFADSYLELCMGPMFSGKTTYLLELIAKLVKENQSFTVVKPILDNRFYTNMITSHNEISYPCTSVDRLNQLDLMKVGKNILIEEGQFFPDLYESTIKLLHIGKKIYVAGLNGDYLMQPLGDMIKLVPLADNIIYKQAVCACSKPASFSCRKQNGNSSQILIGGADVYLPKCKKCYFLAKDSMDVIDMIDLMV